LITKLRAQNVGNEAISTLLIDYLRNSLPDAEIRAIDRVSRALLPLSRRQRHFGPDPVSALESSCRRLLRRYPPDPAGPLAAKVTGSSVSVPGRRHFLLRSLDRTPLSKIAVRTWLTKAGLYGRGEFQRIMNTLMWADSVIWHPAGELYPNPRWTDSLPPLLLLRVAESCGAATFALNQTIESIEPPLQRIVGSVYSRMTAITVREEQSLARALGMGVPEGKVAVAPDLSFLASAEGPAPAHDIGHHDVPAGSILVAVEVSTARQGVQEWDDLFARIGAIGRPLVFVSNDIQRDLPFARDMAERHRITIIERQPAFRELMAMYRRASVIVASRLHSSLLGFCAGVPVVTLEQHSHKIGGIVSQLGFPIETEDRRRGGWAERAAAKVEFAIKDGDALRVAIAASLERQRERIHLAYKPMLESLASIRKSGTSKRVSRSG
jgi:polysaccharide pyruvyl transferase WcaK-like protein